MQLMFVSGQFQLNYAPAAPCSLDTQGKDDIWNNVIGAASQ